MASRSLATAEVSPAEAMTHAELSLESEGALSHQRGLLAAVPTLQCALCSLEEATVPSAHQTGEDKSNELAVVCGRIRSVSCWDGQQSPSATPPWGECWCSVTLFPRAGTAGPEASPPASSHSHFLSGPGLRWARGRRLTAPTISSGWQVSCGLQGRPGTGHLLAPAHGQLGAGTEVCAIHSISRSNFN